MKEKTQRRIIRGAFLRLMISNIMLTIAVSICSLVDNLFVGRMLGKDALAAMAFFSPVLGAAGFSYVIILGAQALREQVMRGEYIDAPCIGCDTGHPIFTKDLELTGNLNSFYEMSINAR